MTVKEGIEKIRLMLASENEEVQVETSEESAPVTELSFETYDLKDGSKIDLSGLEIGSEASIVDESGNTSPASTILPSPPLLTARFSALMYSPIHRRISHRLMISR